MTKSSRYASAFFLCKVYRLRKTDNEVPIIRNGRPSGFMFTSRGNDMAFPGTFLSYMRSLFLIALGNFIFPYVSVRLAQPLLVPDQLPF